MTHGGLVTRIASTVVLASVLGTGTAAPPVLDKDGNDIIPPPQDPILKPGGAFTDFVIDAHGFDFRNDFPGPIEVRLPVPGLAWLIFGGLLEVDLAKKGYGLCGGMIYAARDSFHHESATGYPTDSPGTGDKYTVPDPGTELFAYLWKRQLDSLMADNGHAVTKLIDWTERKLDRLAELTWAEFEYAVATRINAGKTAPLMLVRGHKLTELFSRNHQVLAIGYEMYVNPGSGIAEWAVITYDPNYPGKEKLLFVDSREEWTRNPSSGALNHKGSFRGFFVTRGEAQTPYWAPTKPPPAPVLTKSPTKPAPAPAPTRSPTEPAPAPVPAKSPALKSPTAWWLR